MRSEIDRAITMYINHKQDIVAIGGRSIEKNIHAPYECFKEFGIKPNPSEYQIKRYNSWKRGFNQRKKRYAELFREVNQV